MHLTSETKIFIGIIVGTLLIIGIGVTVYSRPAPSVSRSTLLLSDTPTKGTKDAKVYLVEFSDFQCPACGSFKSVVDSIVEKYKDKMVFGYRHFPLEQHDFAQKAAQSFEAAGEQGKYWEMYDYLFTNQTQFSDEVIDKGAEKLGLDKAKYLESMKSSKILEKIQNDISTGNSLGVNSTPTFFLNGKKLNLYSANDLETEVSKAIKSSS